MSKLPHDGRGDGDVAQLRAEVEHLRAELAKARAEADPLRRVERDLLAQKRFLRTVIDEIPDIIILKDHKGKFLTINKPLADLYGTTPDAVVGKDDGDFSATPEQAEFFRENVLGIMARGETEIVFEETTDGATGDVRYFKSIKKPFLGDDGKPQILVIAHDITDIRRAQSLVAESERRLRYVLEATGEGVWDWNVATGALDHNDRWYKMLGLDSDELTHTLKDFDSCLLDEERAGVMAAIGRCLAGEAPYHHEHRMRRRDGSFIWVLDRGDVVERDADGKPLRVVGSFADITTRKEAETQLERVNANLEALVNERTRALSEANATLHETLLRLKATQQDLVEREKLAALGGLVAGVAHEINTPVGVAVTAISLFQEQAEALASSLESGAMKRSDLVRFLDSTKQLGAIVGTNLARASDLVRDFKQVAVRQSSDAVEEFSLLEALDAAVASIGPEWKRSHVTVETAGDAAVRLRSSPGFVFQVVSNLVVNAIRHAFPGDARGHVRFTVDRVGAEACLRYVDDGVGMPPEVLARIFEPFFTTRRGAGGTGLGLHIVWNLITGQLGGRIEAASEPGKGLVISMFVPCLRVTP